MLDFSTFIQNLRSSFLNRNHPEKGKLWNSELTKISEAIGVDFSPNIHPHFFSGNYYENQIIGITMNPHLSKNLDSNTSYSNYLSKLAFDEFIEEQKNRFKTFNVSSDVYKKFEVLIRKLNPLFKDFQLKKNDHGYKYPLLDRYGVAVDIFPYSSHSFAINLTSISINLIREYYNRIHQDIFKSDKKKRIVIVLSGQITNALLKVKKNGILYEPYSVVSNNKLMGRWGTSHLYILEDKNKTGRIYAVSNWNMYVKEDLLKQYAKIILQTSYRI